MNLNRFNEFKYAEEVIENGFLSKYVKYELKIIAKYYKFKGIDFKEIEERLYSFCEKYLNGFSKVKYFKMINSIINYAKKENNKLIIIESIPITQGELDYIDNVDIEEDFRVFLFSLLVRYKLDKALYEFQNEKKYTGGCFSYKVERQKEVFKISQLKRYKYKFDNILHEFYKKGLIDIYDNGKLRLLFLDEMSGSEEVVISINTISMDYVGFIWQRYKGNKRIKNCSLCDIIIESKFGRKYCEECTLYMQNAHRRKTWNKNKDKYRKRNED